MDMYRTNRLVANALVVDTVVSYTPGTVMPLPSVVVVATGLLAGVFALTLLCLTQ
jgi:hypothetical protein